MRNKVHACLGPIITPGHMDPTWIASARQGMPYYSARQSQHAVTSGIAPVTDHYRQVLQVASSRIYCVYIGRLLERRHKVATTSADVLATLWRRSTCPGGNGGQVCV